MAWWTYDLCSNVGPLFRESVPCWCSEAAILKLLRYGCLSEKISPHEHIYHLQRLWNLYEVRIRWKKYVTGSRLWESSCFLISLSFLCVDRKCDQPGPCSCRLLLCLLSHYGLQPSGTVSQNQLSHKLLLIIVYCHNNRKVTSPPPFPLYRSVWFFCHSGVRAHDSEFRSWGQDEKQIIFKDLWALWVSHLPFFIFMLSIKLRYCRLSRIPTTQNSCHTLKCHCIRR